MADIFISYASGDRSRVEPIAKAIEGQGWSVWWDRIIPPGRTFDDVIEEELESARCVIVIWSDASVASQWVRTEASEGMRRGLLVPALIDDIKIPLEFRRVQAATLVDWRGESSHPEFEKLIQSIAAHAPRPSAGTTGATVDEAQESPQPPGRIPSEKQSVLSVSDKKQKQKKVKWTLGISLAAVVIAVGLSILLSISRPIKVPDLVGKPIDNARQIIKDANLEPWGEVEKPTDEVSPGTVIEQDPKPGMPLREGERIALVVATSPPPKRPETPPDPAEIPPVEPVHARPGKLFVNTEPREARIRILNIAPKFDQGMELEPGRYQVEVSATGYEKKTVRVEVGAGEEKRVEINLEAEKDITNSIGMKFALIQAGHFTMGSPEDEQGRDDDEQQHEVTISKPFYLQTTEVTQGQWRKVMGNNPSHFKNCGDDCPVEQVSWYDCQEFIAKLNKQERGNNYRLPTEAEWEYACRAGTETPFSFGNCLSTEQANYAVGILAGTLAGCPEGKDRDTIVPVAKFPPNAWGLYDMHGNVWEWCQDWHGDYHSANVIDPEGTPSGSDRVGRGGGFDHGVRYCRSAERGFNKPERQHNDLGFRLAWSLP